MSTTKRFLKSGGFTNKPQTIKYRIPKKEEKIVCTVAAGPVKEMLTVTKNSSADERTLPEKLDTQDYEKFIEKGLLECRYITTLGRTFKTKDIIAYEYKKYEYKTDEIVLYFDNGTMIATQITDVIFL